MPLGTQENAVVDKLLTNVSNAIVPQGFIAEQILTPLSVVQTTGKIGRYGNAHLRIQSNTEIVGKKKYPRVETIIRETDTYDIAIHGLEDMLTLKDYANVERPFNAERDLTMGLTTSLLLGKEKSLADVLGDDSVITNGKTLSGNAQYNNLTHDSSDPIGDAAEAHSSIRSKIGVRANSVAMSGAVFDYLQYHDKILDKLGFKDNRAGSLSQQEIARALNVQNIYVGDAIYNTAKEGQADSMADVWGKIVVYFYKAPAQGLYQKTLGYDITLAGQARRQVQKFDIYNPRGSKGFTVDDNYDLFIADANAAFLIKDAVA